MKKFILFILTLVFFCTFLYAKKGYDVKFSQPTQSEYQISFELTQWDLQGVRFDGVDFQQIIFGSSAVTIEKGWAELPFVNTSIQLPAQKDVDLNVVFTEYVDIQLNNPLLPSRGTIIRSQDPSTIPYEIDENSLIDAFYPETVSVAESPYIIRDVRGTTVTIYPFQWNAVTMTLRVYSKITVMLTENEQPATNPLLRENPNPIREVRGMYRSIFVNYAEPKIPLVMAEYGDILVITTARDETAIQPYIDWKKEKGYNVEKEVVSTGVNVKSIIQNKYNANNNLMYVLLVGGWPDIKSDLVNFGFSLGSGPTDPILGDVAGNVNDYRPDISIGRMPGSNAAEITIQVNKTIQYEKNPNMDAEWYSSFIGIGSNDNGPADDGEKDWLHIQRIYDQRLVPVFDYNVHRRLYENESGCTAANLSNYINTGASTIAYCGHGQANNWVTTGFSNSHINNLTNGQKMPFIVSVACVNGSFHNTQNCFAETWLKKQNGGAVITWMATINQPWAPPMRGQDYFYDILIGGFAYNQGQYGLPTDEQRTHWGAIAVNAANLMLSEVNTSDDKATVRTWTTFGDPALQLRTKLPAQLASSMPLITPGVYVTTITADGTPVEGALVCISQDGVYYSAFTDEDGVVSIENDFTPGEALLVVTGFNTTTIYETLQVDGELEFPAPINLTYTIENANHVILSWDAPEGNVLTVQGYNVYRDNEKINIELVRDEMTFKDIVPQNGEYEYEVTALYGSTFESDFSEPVTVIIDGMCIPIANNITLEQIEGANILVSWEAPKYDGLELAGYNLYRGEEQINAEIIPATELSFLDEDLEPENEYCYVVEVVYNDCEEPLKTEEECLILVSIIELPGQELSIFPNPTTGELRIENGEFRINNVEVFDVYGRKQNVENRIHNVLNISHLSAGVYFIKITTEAGNVIKKAVKQHP